MSEAPVDNASMMVRHFREIMVWPLELMPLKGSGDGSLQHWTPLTQSDQAGCWREIRHQARGDEFHERHYNEFVAFLPYAQRMLYGEARGTNSGGGSSPIRTFRRKDVSKLRVRFPADLEAIELQVAHVDLHFFYDVDVMILAVEVCADDIPFARAQEIMHRLGRSYPTYWTGDGRGGHCFHSVEWLDAEGEVLAASDYNDREKYLGSVSRHLAPCISQHWSYLLRPYVLDHSEEQGAHRYRLVEYHRMPLCVLLTFDDPRELSRADFLRLATVSKPSKNPNLPMSARQARDFERKNFFDQFWNLKDKELSSTRAICTGNALIMVGSASERAYRGGGPVLREVFRHQYFLLFLIAHLQRAVLLLISDRLLIALNGMEIGNTESVRLFKREIRHIKEVFLRFSHRYWHRELSDQLLARSIFRMARESLATERMYDDVREEIDDMSDYLDSDSIRRQANMVIRLTVVTILSLIGSTVTGFLGMNLFAMDDSSFAMRSFYFLIVFVPVVILVFVTILKSKRLADFLDMASDERLPLKDKVAALKSVWPGSGGGDRTSDWD